MNLELRRKLEMVAGRIRSLRLWSGLALVWLLWAAVGGLMWIISRSGSQAPLSGKTLATLAAITAAVCVFAILRTARDQRRVARRVEARHPELATLLLAAVEQVPPSGQKLGFLQTAVVRGAVEHGRRHDWIDAVSTRRLRLAQLANLATLGLLLVVCVTPTGRAGADVRSPAPIEPVPDVAGEPPAFDVKIEPGNTEIERGTSLLVIAEFGGMVPLDATLMVASDEDEISLRNMVRSLDDPKFVGRVPAVRDDLSYYVEFDGRRTETYRVTVFDYPELVRADADLVYPSYTMLEPTVVQDVRHVTAVEGTQLTLLCTLNKEVVEAQLVGSDGRDMELVRDGEGDFVYRAGWTLTESRRFKLRLVDEAGRENRFPAEIVINVTPNRPPRIAIERPGRDVDVSPLEEMQLKATVTDDFGVVQRGVSYSHGGGEPNDVTLPSVVPPVKRQGLEYLIDFEALEAAPDDLVSYYVWAEDVGPDGQPRRVYSDMYFAEVRQFEEIYRQGQQPSQAELERRERERQEREQQQQEGDQQGDTSRQAGELADLQKAIINATWKLVRRETGAQPTDEFAEDSRSLQEAQQSALEQLGTLAEQLMDGQSAEHVETARNAMEQSLERLTAAADGPSAGPLRQALSAEQEAYQALLRLRAREFEVIRGQQGQQGQQGQRGQRGQRGQQGQRGQRNSLSNRQQRQLGQLELSADENRYEMQTRADASTPEETAAQREQREVLNRLQQLARRQGDVNERMRELQSELESAQTQEQRDEIERELRRLRDQQQEVLRETDELIGRLDNADNQQQVQEARDQLEEGRNRMQQATEALDEGRLAEARTEGTRAGRQLSDVRDQFRQQSANRFTEEMTDLRRAARNLDEQQQQLSEEISQRNEEAGRSLRDEGQRAETLEGLNQQRQQLSDLLERMQQTVEEAEQPEPLLARQLYDTIRQADQQRIDDALDVTQRLLEVGIDREASQAMQAADEGIDQLRRGVERAAQSVLGDEAEALRRAQRQVDQLAEEINREIQQALGEQADDAGQADAQQQDQANGGGQDQAGGQNENADEGGQGAEGERGARGARGGGQNAADEQGANEPGQGGQGERGQRGARGGGQNAGEEQGANGPGQRGQGERGQRGARGARGGGQNADENQEETQPGDVGPGARGQRGGNRGGGGPDRIGTDRGGLSRLLGGGGGAEWRGPITGDDFRDWSDRLRDVEEMLDDENLRSDAARIRDRATDVRREYRGGATPDWNKLQDMVAEPLVELSRHLSEEIRRRESPDSLVPIDRDPVPPEYAEQVRRYYERLGSGE